MTTKKCPKCSDKESGGFAPMEATFGWISGALVPSWKCRNCSLVMKRRVLNTKAKRERQARRDETVKKFGLDCEGAA